LENQIKTLEYVNAEYASQERQSIERIKELEDRIKRMEPTVVISPKSVSPAKSVIPAKRVKKTESEHSENAEGFESSEGYESAEDQLSPRKRIRETKGKGKAVAEYESDSREARAEGYESAEDQLSPRKRIQSVRETKGKGKAVAEYESDSKEARAEMKVLMKTIPQEFRLLIDEVFSSSENKKILNRLVPELLKSMAPRFYPSRKQLYEWLGALHRHQRGRYRKTQTGKLDADNRRLHANSRLSEVRIIEFLYTHYFMY
jgi:hypothetical protein